MEAGAQAPLESSAFVAAILGDSFVYEKTLVFRKGVPLADVTWSLENPNFHGVEFCRSEKATLGGRLFGHIRAVRLIRLILSLSFEKFFRPSVQLKVVNPSW